MSQLDHINEPIIQDSERIYKIYSLNCPYDTEIVRYIGFTKLKLEERLYDHLGDLNKNTHKINWLKKLKKSSLKPIIILIQDNLTFEEAQEMEMHYIKMFKSFGANLTNGTIGGDGVKGYRVSDETRAKLSKANKGKKGFWTGKKRSKETNDKISKTLTGRKNGPPSEEHIQKIIKAKKGIPFSREHKEKLSIAHIGKTLSPEHIRNMSISMIGKNKGKPSWIKGKKQSKETIEKKRNSLMRTLERIRQEKLTMIF